jgi:hypothetical protein
MNDANHPTGRFSVLGWITKRVRERTTWDGIVLIVVGVAILLFKGLIPWIAWGAIAFGAWTVWTSEKR